MLIWVAPTGAAERTTRDFQFETSFGTTHAARLVLPPEGERNGYSVMLIGGGSVTDMHWSIPGWIEDENGRRDFTISGEPTRDADTLANAIADAGFVVMQWSSIYEGDPMRAENPWAATPMPYPISVTVSREALHAMKDQPEVDPDRIILLGHSLGATRACELADEAQGLVMLAGAYLTRIAAPPSRLHAAALQRWSTCDSDKDQRISPAELETCRLSSSAPRAFATFDTLDADGDGLLAAWELAAAELLGRIVDAPKAHTFETTDEFRDGAAWPPDVLMARRDMPVLSIHGGLDPGSVHGPILAEMARLHGRDTITIEYAPGLGHQLSIEREGKFAPMEPRVVEHIVHWLSENFAQQSE